MAVNVQKGYPDRVLEDSYYCATDANIKAGMMVKLNAQSILEKATGVDTEYAMLAMNNQPRPDSMENGGKVQVVKENVSAYTDYFKAGAAYTPHCKLQVSVTVGEEGYLTPHAGGAAPVIGRFVKFEKVDGVNMMLFDLVRS